MFLRKCARLRCDLVLKVENGIFFDDFVFFDSLYFVFRK